MRTTIEITAEQRARLVEMVARRGEKRFSKLVQRAVMLKGVLESRAATREIRESWK